MKRSHEETENEENSGDSTFLDFGHAKEFPFGTNIKNIKVPDYIKQKVSCGISWVDDALGGFGFTPTSCGMITGGAGAGKTTFMLQLADAITKQGHICVFNTGEESLYQVGLTVDRLKLSNGFLTGQEVLCPTLLKNIEELNTDKNKKLFLLIDSLQCLNDGKYRNGGMTGNTSLRVCKQLTEYTKNCKLHNIVTLFVGQVTKSGEFAGKNPIKHMIDMHLHLYIDADKRSDTFGERIFTNYKNRFGCSGRTYVLGLDEKGLHKKGQFH